MRVQPETYRCRILVGGAADVGVDNGMSISPKAGAITLLNRSTGCAVEYYRSGTAHGNVSRDLGGGERDIEPRHPALWACSPYHQLRSRAPWDATGKLELYRARHTLAISQVARAVHRRAVHLSEKGASSSLTAAPAATLFPGHRRRLRANEIGAGISRNFKVDGVALVDPRKMPKVVPKVGHQGLQNAQVMDSTAFSAGLPGQQVAIIVLTSSIPRTWCSAKRSLASWDWNW